MLPIAHSPVEGRLIRHHHGNGVCRLSQIHQDGAPESCDCVQVPEYAVTISCPSRRRMRFRIFRTAFSSSTRRIFKGFLGEMASVISAVYAVLVPLEKPGTSDSCSGREPCCADRGVTNQVLNEYPVELSPDSWDWERIRAPRIQLVAAFP